MKVSSLSRGVLEKASQSFAAAAAKGFGIVFGAALPTPKTHLRPQVCPKGARSGLQSPRPEKAGRPFLARKKRPRLFQVRGVECCSRGTTLVQPPVTRTALKASNKAAASLHLMFYILTKERRFVKWIFPRGRGSGAHPSGGRAWTPRGAGRRGGRPPAAGNRCPSSLPWWSRPGAGN